MSLWFIDENDNKILLYAGSKDVIERFKKKHNMSDYMTYGYPTVISCGKTFETVKKLQKEEFYKQKRDDNIPTGARHMFDKSCRIIKEIDNRKKKERSDISTLKKSKENGAMNRRNLPNDKDFALLKLKGVASLLNTTHKINKINNEIKEDVNTYISKKEIVDQLNKVREELEVLYADIAYNKTIATFKEGQIHAYNILLKLLDK